VRKLIRLLLGTSALFAAFITCVPAYGQLVTTTYGPFSVDCTPVGQLCDNTFSRSVTTTSNLRVEYFASAGHCSPVLVHILVDGVEKAATAFLSPGQASGVFDVGPVTAGPHVVALRGEGTVSGCNTGNLANWGGTLAITADVQPVAAVPAVSPPLLLLLAAAVLLAARSVFTRRQ
jgi:hypothetical protein